VGSPSQSSCPAGHWHPPATQVAPAGHARPQPPQFWTSEPGSTSQPLLALRSQSSRPGAQVAEQVLPWQSVPGHAVPQAPQLSASAVRSAHAPLQVVSGAQASMHEPIAQCWPGAVQSVLEQQSLAHDCPPQQWVQAAEELHVPAGVQVSVVQPLASVQSVLAQQARQAEPQSWGVARLHAQAPLTQLDPVLQTAPHAPQFVESEAPVLVSQPRVTLPSQSAKPAAHAGLPPPHEAWTPTATPQAPQLEGSVPRTTHELPHRVSPGPQALTHAVPLQSCPAPQCVVHDPQVAGAEAEDSHPACVVQSRKPAEQAHTPAAHAWLSAQLTVHLPQVATAERSASQPLAELLSQSAKPVAQPQTPPVQDSCVPQGWWHPPQLAGSVSGSDSQPFTGLPSQSLRPVGHVQVPPAQLMSTAHTVWQLPQCLGSVLRSISQPLTTFWSQSS
jgi:hypothetical protein